MGEGALRHMSLNANLQELVTRAQSGDVGAISELYDRYAGVILRYLVVRVYEHELAQDLTQEVFIRVIKGIVKFEYRDEKSFLGWLYTISGNVLNSHQRRRKLLSTPLDSQEELIDSRSQNDVRAICDRIALQQALEQLTDDQQQVLALRFFADMTNSEIATLLNRTEGAIKALQHRALQSLHRIMIRENDDRSLPGSMVKSDVSANGAERDLVSNLQQREVSNDRTMRRIALDAIEARIGD